jgi:hypothetical protein
MLIVSIDRRPSHPDYEQALNNAGQQRWADFIMRRLPTILEQGDKRLLSRFENRIRNALVQTFPNVSEGNIPTINWETRPIVQEITGGDFVVPTVQLPYGELIHLYERMGYLDTVPVAFAAGIPTEAVTENPEDRNTRLTTVVFTPVATTSQEMSVVEQTTNHEHIHAADPNLYYDEENTAPAEMDLVKELKPWVGEAGIGNGIVRVDPRRVVRYLRGSHLPSSMLSALGISDDKISRGVDTEEVAQAVSSLVERLTRNHSRSDVVRKLMGCRNLRDIISTFPELRNR